MPIYYEKNGSMFYSRIQSSTPTTDAIFRLNLDRPVVTLIGKRLIPGHSTPSSMPQTGDNTVQC